MTLFIEAGYLVTTIKQIADRAGVAVQTVYYAYGTKRNLLARALDASVAGDVDTHPMDLPWVEQLRSEQDPVAAVARLTNGAVEIVARASPIYEVIRSAAADPEVAALLEENRRERYLRQRELVGLLAAPGTWLSLSTRRQTRFTDLSTRRCSTCSSGNDSGMSIVMDDGQRQSCASSCCERPRVAVS